MRGSHRVVGDAAKVIQDEPIEISSVPEEMVRHVWQSQIDMIERGLRHGEGDNVRSDDILAKVFSGEYILWAIHQGTDIIAISVVSVIRTRKTKLFVKLIAGRDMSLWLGQYLELLADFKDVIGADCIEASCRPGLAKILLSEHGWSTKATVMELI